MIVTVDCVIYLPRKTKSQKTHGSLVNAATNQLYSVSDLRRSKTFGQDQADREWGSEIFS